MMRIRLYRVGGRLGWPGALGVAVWLATAALFVGVVLPAQEQVDALRERTATLRAGTAQSGGLRVAAQPSPAEQLAAFYAAFPSEPSSPDWIGKIAATAKRSGLSLDQGEYRLSRDTVGKLARLQITLPVRGDYRQIRQFLARTSAEVPTVVLEQVQFERQKVGDTEVDAKIRLVLYMEQPS
jgi:Tfp pilus assembly protein PilO